jgi:uncharacterized membrane protein
MSEKQIMTATLLLVLIAVTVNIVSLIVNIINKNKKLEEDKRHEKS